jgi:uncharacterized protein (TIGR03435 family)
MRVVFGFLLVLLGSRLTAQQSSAVAFDVISIKPNKNDSAGQSIGGDKGVWRATNVTAKDVILNAYEILPEQIVRAPSWFDSDRFDIQASFHDEGALPAVEALRLRIRALLAERFGFTVHFDTKELQSYILVVSSKGHKLTPSEAPFGMKARAGHMECTAITMDLFARNLAGRVKRPVTNRTELNGNYDLTLDYEPDMGAPSEKPSLFTALQEQLGLKLESKKAVTKTLVIDHLDRPSPN